MIRHKATGTELAWRPTHDRWGNEGTGWKLTSADGSITEVYVYEACDFGPPGSRSAALAEAVADGDVEIIPDESPPNDYDAIHRADEIDQAIDEHNRLLEDARALAIRLFLAGHDDAACELRRLL